MTQEISITGGAGFIGTNLAERLLNNGKRVTLFDNLSRSGVEQGILQLHNWIAKNARLGMGVLQPRE